MSRSPRPRRPLLATAIEVFAQRGFTGTSLDHLHEAMALDPAAFRCRFANKEGCFLAAYDRIAAAAHAHIAASLRREAPWPARVGRAASEHDSAVILSFEDGFTTLLLAFPSEDRER